MLNKKGKIGEVCNDIPGLERRDVPRFNIKEPGMLIIIDGNNSYTITGQVLDISEQGLLITIKESLRLNGKIHFMIKWIHACEILEGSGRIIRTITPDVYEKKILYGINFNNRDLDIQQLKNNLLEYQQQLSESNRRKIERRQEQNKSITKDKRNGERRNLCVLFKKCSRFNRLESIMSTSYYIYQREIFSGAGRKICRSGKMLLNFASNNYLGLATHPDLKTAAIKAVKKYGPGTTGSRLLNGTTELHTELENQLAEFTGNEACMICTTGFSLNISIISALVSANTIVLIDNKVHASIVDGCFLSPAKIHIFRHNDIQDLKRKLDKTDPGNPKLMIIDGVYSMKGDVARLDKLYELTQKYAIAVMMDDAHGIGVLGKTGRGTAEKFGLSGKIDLHVATLSKAFGSLGGFVAARENVIRYLKHNTRSYIFATSLPAASCAASLKALEIIKKEPERRERLAQNIQYFKHGLIHLGFPASDSESAIIPLDIHEENLTYQLDHFLEQEGIFVNAFVYPAVKKGEAGLRISLQANHTQKDLDFLLDKLEKAKKNLAFGKKDISPDFN